MMMMMITAFTFLKVFTFRRLYRIKNAFFYLFPLLKLDQIEETKESKHIGVLLLQGLLINLQWFQNNIQKHNTSVGISYPSRHAILNAFNITSGCGISRWVTELVDVWHRSVPCKMVYNVEGWGNNLRTWCRHELRIKQWTPMEKKWYE